MLNYQTEAINRIREYARKNYTEHQALTEDFCSPFEIDVSAVINRILRNPVTINFHPDRFSNNGKTIITNLIEQGQYHGQFRTGTSNGGLGDNRFSWEQRIFFDAYPPDSADRPKYGALNIFRYIDGASVRFGSCFFVLKPETISRCTFAYGDSSTNPATLCTSGTFVSILAGLFDEYLSKGKALNQVLTFSSKKEVLAILLNPCDKIKDPRRNLDCCIETHIHGDIRLDKDIESFYVDGSFKNTFFGEQAETICKKYGITIYWIPERQIDISTIGNLFRGPKIPVIAHPKSVSNDAIVLDLLGYGAEGLEVFHPIHTKNDIIKYSQMTRASNKYITGGTDWHGKNNGAEITHFGMCGLENDDFSILKASE